MQRPIGRTELQSYAAWHNRRNGLQQIKLGGKEAPQRKRKSPAPSTAGTLKKRKKKKDSTEMEEEKDEEKEDTGEQIPKINFENLMNRNLIDPVISDEI